MRFSDTPWLCPVRFGAVPRPILAGSGIQRFGSVRPVGFGFSFLPVKRMMLIALLNQFVSDLGQKVRVEWFTSEELERLREAEAARRDEEERLQRQREEAEAAWREEQELEGGEYAP